MRNVRDQPPLIDRRFRFGCERHIASQFPPQVTGQLFKRLLMYSGPRFCERR